MLWYCNIFNITKSIGFISFVWWCSEVEWYWHFASKYFFFINSQRLNISTCFSTNYGCCRYFCINDEIIGSYASIWPLEIIKEYFWPWTIWKWKEYSVQFSSVQLIWKVMLGLCLLYLHILILSNHLYMWDVHPILFPQ